MVYDKVSILLLVVMAELIVAGVAIASLAAAVMIRRHFTSMLRIVIWADVALLAGAMPALYVASTVTNPDAKAIATFIALAFSSLGIVCLVLDCLTWRKNERSTQFI